MSTQKVELLKIECGNYLFLARPCVEISNETARALANRAETDDLDFIGIVYENINLPEGAAFEEIKCLRDDPSMVMLLRNIGAGIYKKDFLKKCSICVDEDRDVLFPDIVLLWNAFVYARRAMFVSASVCERVHRDTVWIDDSCAAFSVNRDYDHVKDMLMSDWELWQKWKGYYSIQRWRCYFEILHWMTEEVGWTFAERMVVDFHRSYELDEIDETLFTLEERTALYVLAKDPGFVKRFYLGKIIMNKKMFDANNEFDRRAAELNHVIEAKEREKLEQAAAYEGQKAELNEQIAGLNEQMRQERADSLEQYRALEERSRMELENEKNKYETSTTFRVGKIIMFIPVSIKKFIIKLIQRKK